MDGIYKIFDASSKMAFLTRFPLSSSTRFDEMKFDDLNFYNAINAIRVHFSISLIPMLRRKKSSNLKGHILGATYSILCLASFLAYYPCFNLSVGYFLFMAVTKTTSVLTWWIVYRRRNKFEKLVQQIYSLKKQVGLRLYRNWNIVLKSCIVLLQVAILIPAFFNVLSGSYKNSRCHLFGVVLQAEYAIVIRNFLMLMTDQQFEWGIHYSIAILYCFCCRQASQIMHALCLKKRSFSSRKMRLQYYLIRKTVKCIEKRFSSLVLIFLGRSFFEFFKILSFLFDRVILTVDIKFTLTAVLYSSVTLVVFTSVIIAADNLQIQFRNLCDKMMQSLSGETNLETGVIQLKTMILLSEDRRQLKLTCGGLFQLTKGLLLTAAASFISYGVLMLQFKK